MLKELSDKSRQMGLKMNIVKTRVIVVDNTSINVSNVLIENENVEGYTYIWDNNIQSQGKEPGQRGTTKDHDKLDGIRQSPRSLQKQPCHLPEDTGVQLLCAASYDVYGAEIWILTKQAQNKLAAAQAKMESSMLNITYKDRRTNIWDRERTT